MLRIESKTGMIFAVDLRDVNHIRFANGVVYFLTIYNQQLQLGGPDWGGVVSSDDAHLIMDRWEDARMGDEYQDEDDDQADVDDDEPERPQLRRREQAAAEEVPPTPPKEAVALPATPVAVPQPKPPSVPEAARPALPKPNGDSAGVRKQGRFAPPVPPMPLAMTPPVPPTPAVPVATVVSTAPSPKEVMAEPSPIVRERIRKKWKKARD